MTVNSICPPFKVVLVDQFSGQDEDGYVDLDSYGTLAEAIDVAKKITEEGIRKLGSFDEWYGIGSAGLVYDDRKMLVWDGINEYAKINGISTE